jgi:2-iminobutanoate/2-iminopropanoate deaminase
MADFDEMNETYLARFPEPLPARTTVGVKLRGFKVEIDCVAVRPRGRPGGRREDGRACR